MSDLPGPALQPNNTFANVIGGGVALFLCGSTAYLMWRVLNSNEQELTDKVINIAIYILGFLTAKISTIVDWCFGGSSATKRQGEIIATQANTIQAAQDKLPIVPGAPDKTVPLAAGDTVVVKADPPHTGDNP